METENLKEKLQEEVKMVNSLQQALFERIGVVKFLNKEITLAEKIKAKKAEEAATKSPQVEEKKEDESDVV